MVGLVDLAATMAEAAGCTWPGGGNSLLPLARDVAAPWPDETFSEYCQGVRDPWSAAEPTVNRMIRRGRYKLNYYRGMAPQLFDLEADPDELHDLAADPHYAAIVKTLLARVLAGWDPDDTARQLLQRDRESAVLQAWVKEAQPPETHRWSMPEGRRPSLA